MSQSSLIIFCFYCWCCFCLWPVANCLMQVGAGIADVTGPVCQVNTMGYANAHLSGLHTRLFSRAFAFKDSNGRYAAYAVVDIAMISHLIKFVVGNRLAAETNGRYSEANVMLSATHTHAGPGGYNQDLFLVLNTPGFERKHFDYIVDGIVQSILTADSRLAPARVLTNSGQLYNASINRHPFQYLLNTEAERAHYSDNIDREMFLLRFDNAVTAQPIGSVAWFPVHGTSLNVSNRYVSGDNKGVASLLMESHFGGNYVAAFPQAHSGDVTPNTRGAFSAKNGTRCDSPIVNTFDCRSKGPGVDQFDSLMIIGRKQFEMALKLHQSASVSELVGPDPQLATVYDVRDVTSEAFPIPWTDGDAPNENSARLLRVCPAAFGYKFCGGTVDGYGMFDYFTMGRRQSSVLINLIRDIMGPVTPEDQACHSAKQICMNAGRIMWSEIPFMSNTVPTQILRIGQLFITALPAEITTMSGRRLMRHLQRTPGFPKNGKVQLNGLSNGYFFYITTEHEYNGTYYEAGATLYGPNTLAYYAWHMGRLMSHLLGTGGQPPLRLLASDANLDKSERLEAITGQPNTGYDFPGLATNFGDLLNATRGAYAPGDSVQLTFISCNPRNSLAVRGHSFVLVERYSERLHRWLVASTDSGLDTKFRWYPQAFFQSVAMVTWTIPAGQQPGYYRIRHQGHCRPLLSGMLSVEVRPFSGVSDRFRVLPDGLWRPDQKRQISMVEETDRLGQRDSNIQWGSGELNQAAALTAGSDSVSAIFCSRFNSLLLTAFYCCFSLLLNYNF